MKKVPLVMILSAAITFAGIFAKPYSQILCACLIFGGLILFFGTMVRQILHRGGKVCPNFGQRIYVTAAQMRQTINGMIGCPKCSALVRVDHVSPR